MSAQETATSPSPESAIWPGYCLASAREAYKAQRSRMEASAAAESAAIAFARREAAKQREAERLALQAAEALRFFTAAWKPLRPRSGAPRIDDIQRTVASYYSITRADIISARRTADIILPRQVAVYLARKLTSRSLQDIGWSFGGRDHTTALSSLKKIDRLRQHNPALREDIARLSDLIAAGEPLPDIAETALAAVGGG